MYSGNNIINTQIRSRKCETRSHPLRNPSIDIIFTMRRNYTLHGLRLSFGTKYNEKLKNMLKRKQ